MLTVGVQRSVEWHFVNHGDFHPIVLLDVKKRPRKLPVDQDHLSFKSVWCMRFPGQLERVAC